MTQSRTKSTPTPAAAKRPPPPPPDDDEEEFSEAGTLVIDEALGMHADLPDEGGGEFAKFLKLVEGNNFLRFLPPEAGKTVPWVYTWQHGWGAGANYRTINCPAMMSKTPVSCPICEERERLLKTGRDADKVSAGKLKAKLRVITEVVNLTDDGEAAKGVQLFAYGRKISDALAGILGAGAKMGGDFTHKKTGFPIQIVREGSGMDTEYPTVSRAGDRQPVEGEWLLNRTDLSRFTKLPTREEMAKALQGIGISGRAAPAPSSQPSRTARAAQAPARRSNVADAMNEIEDDAGYEPPDELPEEEVEGDEEYQAEPEPPPPPRRATPPAARRTPMPPARR